MFQRVQYVLMAFVAVALFAMSRHVVQDMRALTSDQSFYTTQLSEVTRLEKEMLQFRVNLHDYVNSIGGVTKDDVQLSLDILWSRLNTQWTKFVSPTIDALRDYRRDLAGFAAELKAIDSDVVALAPGDQQRLQRIEGMLQRFAPAMSTMNADAYAELIGRSVDLAITQRRVTRNLDYFQWLFIVVCFAGFIVLLWQLRRSEKLYAELKQREAEIRNLATLDPLTGLYNRRYFDDRMRAIDEGQWQGDCHLLLIDLDSFKQINDSHGHEAGDHVLKEIAGRIRRVAHPDAIVARLGGDEFVITQFGSQASAIEAAERIIRELKEPVLHSSRSLVIGGSIGISSRLSPSKHSSKQMREADMALYRAKAEGRSRYKVFDGTAPEPRKSAA